MSIPADEVASVKGAEKLKLIRSEEGLAIYQAGAGSYNVSSALKIIAPAVSKTASESATAALRGDEKDWKVSPGCSVKTADAVMTVTPGTAPTHMLTTKVPSFSGDPKVIFRMKTPAAGKAMVRLVCKQGGKNASKTVEFDLGSPGNWKIYSISIPILEGTPSSLWIGLAEAKEEVSFSEIRLESGSLVVKNWGF